MINKRLVLSRCLIASGLHRIAPGRREAMLLIVNYHRLRPNAAESCSVFDDGVFGPDADTFRQQMRWLKAATVVLDEEGLLELRSTEGHPPGTVLSAVTFDDAYVDCYTRAKPIMDELGIRGIFFVPVDLVESRALGWWDLAAYMLKRTSMTSIRIDTTTYDLKRPIDHSLRRVLNLFKLDTSDRTAELLDKLSTACGVALPTMAQQSAELMTWPQIRELRSAGHAIGSHTLSHRVLTTLDSQEQTREIRDSRRALEAIVGCSIASFAYPVGGPQHINRDSVRLVREAGYEQAFTFNTGFASVPPADRMQIPRESANTLAVLKGKVLWPRVMGLTDAPAVRLAQ